MRLIQAQNIEL